MRRIVPLIGGQLDVRSRPGRGSCFSLTLPAHDDAPLPPPIVTEPRPAHRSLSVLVVDDDPRIVAATIALLEALGHRGIGVGASRDALAVADRIDAALIDYQLGEEQSGLALIAQLRARRPGLAALLVTAESGVEVRARASTLGVDVVAKPANPATIEAFLSRASVPKIDAE